MEPIQVGKVLDDDAVLGEKDAIHIAVVTVTSDERLKPGTRVAFADEYSIDRVTALKLKGVVGIVDPFVTGTIAPGSRFRLFMMPNSITGLRHEWTHPELERRKQTRPLSESELRTNRTMAEQLIGRRNEVEQLAGKMGKTYDGLMRDMETIIETGETIHINTDIDDGGIGTPGWRKIWAHVEAVTGKKKPADIGDWAPYSCSC